MPVFKSRTRGHRRMMTWIDFAMLLVILIGLGLIVYPYVRDALNSQLAQRVSDYYTTKNNRESKSRAEAQLASMKRRNKEIAKKNAGVGLRDYNKAVAEAHKAVRANPAFLEKHTLALIKIPKIGVSLPVFDETTDLLLQKGTCLLPGSSYPTGGKDTHAVITGHRGLSSARLFTDLPELQKGDVFYIQIGKEIHAYQVFKKKVVLPTDVSDLKIVKGKDLVSLITCTPYGINTHRLIVTGRRVPYPPKAKGKLAATDRWNKLKIWLWVAFGIFILALLPWLIRWILLLNRNYRLRVRIVDVTGKPLSNLTLAVVSRKKTLQTAQTDEETHFTSDDEGMLVLEHLRGYHRYYLWFFNQAGQPVVFARAKKVFKRDLTPYMQPASDRIMQNEDGIWQIQI